MTNKQFKRILSMYKEGISKEVCIASIIELCAYQSMEAARWIIGFYDNIVVLDKSKNT